jgi:uncharacterized membrane protein
VINYFEILLLVHIGGAILGFGPMFAHAVTGPLAARKGGSARTAILEGMLAVDKRLLLPVALVTQPLSGTLLIFESGRNKNFFSYEWLWVSILLYIVAFYLSGFVQTPALQRMIAMGSSDDAEMESLTNRVSWTGLVMTLLLVAVVFLMVVKPGN